jgi:predicted component of type VI protein secretion system
MSRAPRHFGLLQRVDGRPVKDEVSEIIQHLQHLLNIRRGYGSFMPDIGLSITDDMWSARPMVELAGHLREQIARFEPRLEDVRIEPEPLDDHLCPAFRIHCRLGDRSLGMLLSMHTVYCHVEVTEE